MRFGAKKLTVPIIQGGMGIGVSLGRLAGAVAACGAMGVISAVNVGFREPDFEKDPHGANIRALHREIALAKELSGGNGMVAVNIMAAVTHYDELCQAAVSAGADAIISGAGLPLSLPEHTRGTNTLCAPIVSSGRAARLLMSRYQKKYGILPDFFVLEGHMAGGHLGFSEEEILSETAKSNEEILREVLAEIQAAGVSIPVFSAGGVFSGADLARLMQLGASGVQIGTRFIATEECEAHPVFKDTILKAQKEDIRIIKSPVGMPARAVYTPLLKRLESGETLPAKRCVNCLTGCKRGRAIPYCISQALIKAVTGDLSEGLFFTGSNAWRIDRICTVKELIGEIMNEYQEWMEKSE